MEVESYSFVLLVQPAQPPKLSESEAAELQEAHLGHLAAMAEAGKLAGAGPFSDRPDESLRGLCFYRTGLEETRELAARDPAVQRGWLEPVVMTWWTPKGTVTFSAG